MRRDEKIKLMVNGLYRSKYQIVSDMDAPCFSCARMTRKSSYRSRLTFCHDCWERYFVRKSGSELSGMDYTRECVRIRDQHTCQDCGKVWSRDQRRFDVHHLNGLCGYRSRKYEKISAMDGLITLCHKCHLNRGEVVDKMRNKSSPRPEKRQKMLLSGIPIDVEMP